MSNKLKKEFEFKLSTNITVHKDGESQFHNKISLFAPNYKQSSERCLIKQSFLVATNKASEKSTTQKNTNDSDDNDENNVPDGEQFISLMYMYLSKEELLDVINAFKELLLTGSGLISGQKITKFHLEQIDADDLDNMLGEYISTFLLPSWMKKAMKK